MRETICRDDTGRVQSIVLIFGSQQRARTALDAESRKSTAATRKVGACARCRKGRKRVCYSYLTHRLLHTMIATAAAAAIYTHVS